MSHFTAVHCFEDARLKSFAEYVVSVIPKWISRYELYKDELTFCCASPEHIVPTMLFMRDHTLCLFKQLVDVTAVDFAGRTPHRFDIVYQLLSFHWAARCRIKLQVHETSTIPSVVHVHPAANWFEREVYDLFGIVFAAHPDLRRILTDYGFEGHPMRKDFPLSGFVEVRYDEEQKRIVQEPLEMTQEFRRYEFLSPVSALASIGLLCFTVCTFPFFIGGRGEGDGRSTLGF